MLPASLSLWIQNTEMYWLLRRNIIYPIWNQDIHTLKIPFTLSTYKTVRVVYYGKHLEICLPSNDLLHDAFSDFSLLFSNTCYKTCQLLNYTFFVMWVIALEEFQVENTTCSWRHNSDFLQMYKSTDVAVRCILLSCCDCHIIHFLNVKPVMFLDWSTLNVKYLNFFFCCSIKTRPCSEYLAFWNIT